MWSVKKKKIFTGVVSVLTVGLLAGAFVGVTYSSSLAQGTVGGTQHITFFSNIPQYKDKGFNEAAFTGSYNYTNKTDQLLGVRSSQFSEDGSSYTVPLEIVYNFGGDIALGAGFSLSGFDFSGLTPPDQGGPAPEHNSVFKVLSQEEYKDKGFVLIDEILLAGDAWGNSLKGISSSIVFSSNEAGFFAGLAAAVYADANDIRELVTWGGMPYVTVIDWMSGFEQGVNYYNNQILGLDFADYNDPNYIYITYGGRDDIRIDYSQSATQTTDVIGGINSWFSGGFEVEGPEGKIAEQKAIGSPEAAVLFPVAGGQTQIALIEATTREHQQVIGVDVDASVVASTEAKKHILGSATKNIEYAAELGLWYQDQYLADYVQYNDGSYDGGQAFQDAVADDQFYQTGGGKEFIGQSDDPQQNWFVEDYGIREGWTLGTTTAGYNSTFKGNYVNDAVDFIVGEGSVLEQTFTNSSAYDPNNGLNTFNDFMSFAYDENRDGNGDAQIEAASTTFAVYGDPTTTPPAIFPWVPDWTIYER